MSMPKISESEWEIMKIIWRNKPITAEEIANLLSNDFDWSIQTVRTFINRLMKKKAIDFEKEGRTYKYYPLVSEEECIQYESKSFLKRVFDGATQMMMTNFIEKSDLTDQEIEQLKKVLLEKQNKGKKTE